MRTAVRPISRAARQVSEGPGDHVGQCVGDQPGLRGQAGRDRRAAALDGRAAFGGEVEQLRHQRGAGHAVDHRVVHLGDEADPAVGQVLDDVHLPRGLVGLERSAHDLGHHLGELLVTTGCGQRNPEEVVGEVEVGVVHPARVVEAEGHRHEPAPEGRQGRNAFDQHVTHPFERVAALGRGRVEDAGVGDLHRGLRCVGVDEHRIDAAQSLHVCPALHENGAGSVERLEGPAPLARCPPWHPQVRHDLQSPTDSRSMAAPSRVQHSGAPRQPETALYSADLYAPFTCRPPWARIRSTRWPPQRRPAARRPRSW